MRNNQKPFVNHHVLRSLMNVKEIPNYNWCEFVLESLRHSKQKWNKSNFGGSVLFLVLYVDHVVRGRRRVERDFFTLVGLTTSMLKSRKKQEMNHGSFGDGLVVERMEEVVDVGVEDIDLSAPSASSINSDLKGYILDLAAATKYVAESHIVLGNKLLKGTSLFSDNGIVKKFQIS